ncbi:choice-of-anchor D domain-containing protein, partial [bacterium]|nr:choice-of-anchor D domain-containing protein [bacterium]
MKKLTLLLFLLSTVIAAASENSTEEQAKDLLLDYLQRNYTYISQSPLRTGILFDLVVPIADLAAYDGRAAQRTVTTRQWLQMSHELRRSALAESKIPEYKMLRALGKTEARERVYPIAVLDYEYNRFRDGADRETAVMFENGKITAIDEASIEIRRVFAAAALQDWTYRGSRVTFRMNRNALYFTNLREPVSSLEIDFDDGLGFRPATDVMTVHYSRTGDKIIRVRASRGDETVESSFRFEVRSLDTPDPHETWQVTATIPHDGNYSSGEAYVYLSDLHTSITNPIILAEGIDLDDSRNWDELYDMLNQEGLVEDVRNMGFDIVVLNHGSGTDYIQGNAYLLVELINQVNAVSADNASIILVGVSMGGQTTRYALTYMETNDMPHHVSTWISFDSPHKGANIPLGIQYWVDFFAGQSSDAGEMRDALNSPAAKQMLLTHFTSPPSANPGPDPLRADFLNDMTSIGSFPEQMRRVAIANGSGTMQGLDFTPGDQLIRWEYSSFLVDITGNSWSLNDVQTSVIFDGEINQIWPLPDESRTVTVNPTWPYDNAPGGKSNSMEEMDAVNTGGYGDIIALVTHHCFIPTVSALNLAVVDPFYNIQANPNIYSLTPFDSIYYPTWNQSHSKIVPENYIWFTGELLLSMPEPVLEAIPASMAFGQVHVDSAAELTVTLANEGTWDISVTEIEFGEATAFSLSSAPALPWTIPYSDSRELTIRFNPINALAYADTLRIWQNDVLTAAVPLSGQGVAPMIALSTDSLGFGEVEVGNAADSIFTISNSGLWELTINSMSFSSGTVFGFLPEPSLPLTIPPSSSEQFPIRFQPTNAVQYNDTLMIAHDAGGPIAVELTGRGVQADISVSPDTIAFGDIWIGTIEFSQFWIHNTGTAMLIIDTVFSDDPGYASGMDEFTISVNDSFPISFTFTPEHMIEYPGEIEIRSNAGNASVVLRGHGVWTELEVEPERIEFHDLAPNEETQETVLLMSSGNTYITGIDAELAAGSPFEI